MRRKVGKLLGDRRVVGGFLLLIQLAIVMFGVSWASTEYHWLTPALTVLSVIIVIWLVRKYDNPMYKITWILVIVLLPLFGGLFYLFWGNTPLNRARTQHQYEPKPPDFTDYMRTPATKELIEQHPRHAARARYIETLDGMSVGTNTETKYFRVGEEMFDSMCEELRHAQKFIFLEYFIIEEGHMFHQIEDILEKKVKEGVEVRLIYDDVGCIGTLPPRYYKQLQKQPADLQQYRNPDNGQSSHQKVCNLLHKSPPFQNRIFLIFLPICILMVWNICFSLVSKMNLPKLFSHLSYSFHLS